MIYLIFHMFILNYLGRCSFYKDGNYRKLIKHVYVASGQARTTNLFSHNDAVSSVEVIPGCTLEGYRNYDLVDLMFTAEYNIGWLGPHNDQMSSARCSCGKYAN